MDLAQQFAQAQPDTFFLDEQRPQALQAYLIARDWLSASATVQSATKAGEGNMNKVLRVVDSNGRSVIVKQARPWVEKFPEIAAPVSRGDTEGEFFQRTSVNTAIASCSPKLIDLDRTAHVLLLEDLGTGRDLSTLYAKGAEIPLKSLTALMHYLSALHSAFTRSSCDFTIENAEMRALNAEHIFCFPFIEDNGLNLDNITPGLAASAAPIRENVALQARISNLGERYLANGNTLLQGDFYPGSFLECGDGVKVIDTEFCFFGDAEFDLGVFRAHMLMAQQPDTVIKAIDELYDAPVGFSSVLYDQYTGIEILRRLLGLAQLPLELSLDEKQTLLDQACEMLLA